MKFNGASQYLRYPRVMADTRKTKTTYRSEQAPDGSWTIFDVPIFSTHVDKRDPDEPMEFSDKWLKKAFKMAQVRQAEDYGAPLHVKHHGFDKVQGAGRFRMTRLAPFTQGGEEALTIFADFFGVRQAVYDMIRKGDLPYRSVEILPPDFAEIDSLALLDDEVPFFRYPLLRIGSELPMREFSRSRVRAYGAGKGGKRIVFMFDGKTFGEDRLGSRLQNLREGKGLSLDDVAASMSKVLGSEITGSTIGQIERDEIETPSAPVLGAFAKVLGVSVESLESLLDAGEEADEGGRFKMDEEEKDEKEDKLDKVLKLLETMAKKFMGEEDNDEEHEDESKKPAFSAGAETVGVADALQAGTNDALMEKFKAMESKLEAMNLQQRISGHEAGLREKGFSETAIKTFSAMAQKSGEQVALGYAKGLETFGPVDPPRGSWSGELRKQDAPDDASIRKYAQQGPETLDRVRELRRSYDLTNCDTDFDTYVACNLTPESKAKFMADARKGA